MATAERSSSSVAVAPPIVILGEPLPGGWHLTDRVGGGELCDVWLARSMAARADRPPTYAVKLLRPQWEDDPRIIALLGNEAQAGRLTRNPHLVPVLDSHSRTPPYYVVMPRLEGCNLARLLASRGALPAAQALWFARQVAEALDALHAIGWMHGDVKPSNVMVSPTGHVTLIDLTFARRGDDAAHRTASRLILGTPHYVAPETFVSALAPDVRSDLYSLGAMLYEMLAGRRPFAGNNLGDLVTQHRQMPPRPLRNLNASVSPAVAQLVHKLLAKQPIRRPQTPREVIDQLLRLEIADFAER